MSSPMFFNIYIETLLEELDEIGVVVLAYADDIVMVLKDELQVRISLNVLESWTERMEMKINKQKSGIVEVGRRKLHNIGEDIRGYKFVKSYKYLGVDLEGKNNLDNHFRRVRRRVFMILSKIRIFSEKMNLHKKRILVKTLIIPHIDYIGAISILNGKRSIE